VKRRLPKIQTFVISIKNITFAQNKMREDHVWQIANNICVKYIDTVAILELKMWGTTSGPKKM